MMMMMMSSSSPPPPPLLLLLLLLLLFLLHVKTGSGTDPASYPVGAGALSPGIKRPGREADQVPSHVDKNIWIYTSTSPYVFMEWCLVS
jgi:hypothetical protein